MKILKIAVLLVVLSLINCLKETASSTPVGVTNPFSVPWSLHIIEQLNPRTGEYEEWREGLRGYEHTELIFPGFSYTIFQEALKHLTNSHVYITKYMVDQEA